MCQHSIERDAVVLVKLVAELTRLVDVIEDVETGPVSVARSYGWFPITSRGRGAFAKHSRTQERSARTRP